ncbi:ATP-independent periplasmic protein-refolding chaperone Spy [Musicola keenii]|uniref:ATP-independent periplasmic protein-refolding chaperone Spy n=1 Tax=Musicola keenii TaxID=2884250 RepID=UPI001783EF3E|nr:ATP-independent periplasmic protein-refolding chaperone Spy [Musicola keenii]
MSKLIAVMFASALALGATGVVYAQGNAAMDSSAPMMQHHRGEHGGKGMEQDMMFRGLNLTEEQKQKMRDIVQNTRKGERPSVEERRAFHSLIASDSFDSAKAQGLVDKMTENKKARLLQRLEIQNKMYNVLTAEQKKVFNDNFEKHMNEPMPPKAPQ